MRIEKHSEAD